MRSERGLVPCRYVLRHKLVPISPLVSGLGEPRPTVLVPRATVAILVAWLAGALHRLAMAVLEHVILDVTRLVSDPIQHTLQVVATYFTRRGIMICLLPMTVVVVLLMKHSCPVPSGCQWQI